MVLRLRSSADGRDLQRRERLAVPLLAAVALAALVLEDDDLLVQALLDDLRLDGDAGDGGTADLHAARIVGEQQRVEHHLGARRAGELLDAKGFSLRNTVLFST